jgi:hypothetical protein
MQPFQWQSLLNKGERLVYGVIRADEKVGSDFGQFIGGRKHQLPHTPPVIAVDTLHVVSQRVRVQRNLGMFVRTEQLRASLANGAITKSGSFGGAGNDSNVLGHGLIPCSDSKMERCVLVTR